MDTNIGKSGSQLDATSKYYMDAFHKHISNNPQNGGIMNGKRQILYAVKIQVTSYAADSENFEKINEEFLEKFTDNLTEAFMSYLIRAEIAESHSFADGYMNEISDSMYRQLSEIHKALSSTLPVAIEDKVLSSLIFHAAAVGLTNFMKGSKQSKMDWFTTPDIVPKCETSGE